MLKIRKSVSFFSALFVLTLIFSGCAKSDKNNDGNSHGKNDKELYISTISWKDLYGNGGKCETGLEVANFWHEGSQVDIYDADSGDLLANAKLTSQKDDPTSRMCTYKITTFVKEVDNYRFVFDNARFQVEKSLADLKIMANQFALGDLVFVYEIGA